MYTGTLLTLLKFLCMLVITHLADCTLKLILILSHCFKGEKRHYC